MTIESKKAKTTIKHPRETKKLRKQKMAKNKSKLFLSGKFDFDPEEILDKSLSFDSKKNKWRKNIWFNIWYLIWLDYIEHREGMNTLIIRKDSKQTERDELKTMLETVYGGIKRTMMNRSNKSASWNDKLNLEV